MTVGGEGERPDGGGVPGEGLERVPVVVGIVYVELDGVVVGRRCEDLKRGRMRI